MAGALSRAGFALEATTLVVAASGGPDSTALLRCLHKLRQDYSLNLHVAHLNHDFRGAEADHDAAFVQRLADSLGLPCSTDKQDPIVHQKQRGVSSFEQAAREMRYSFLSAVSKSEGAAGVALGHTTDDQAETVLLHLLRGSGLHGLRGMAETATWPWAWPEPGPPPLLFRPLLGATKAEAAGYCRALGQPFREDSGNYMWRFTRNKVRLDLMPRLARDYNPRVREALVRLARTASEELDFVECELDARWPMLADEEGPAVRLNIPALSGLHQALQRHALRRAFSTAAGDVRGLSESHLDAMLHLAGQKEGGRAIDLPRGVEARREYDALTIADRSTYPSPVRVTGEHPVIVPSVGGEGTRSSAGGWQVEMQVIEPEHSAPVREDATAGHTAMLCLEALGDSVTVRTRLPGDRFQPSGMTGTKKLQDFFTDAKIPREQRDGIPLLVCERGIAWVVGHRVADWATSIGGTPSVQVHFTPR